MACSRIALDDSDKQNWAVEFAGPAHYLEAWNLSAELCRAHHMDRPPCFFPSDFSNRPGIREIDSIPSLVNSCPAITFFHEYRKRTRNHALLRQHQDQEASMDLLCSPDHMTEMSLNSYTPLQATSGSPGKLESEENLEIRRVSPPTQNTREVSGMIETGEVAFIQSNEMKDVPKSPAKSKTGERLQRPAPGPKNASKVREGFCSIFKSRSTCVEVLTNLFKTQKLPDINDVECGGALDICAGAWLDVDPDCAWRCVLEFSELIHLVGQAEDID